MRVRGFRGGRRSGVEDRVSDVCRMVIVASVSC